ncbi:glycosyltransferase family 2 protein [Yoonia sp.]|uniref:glycosyltransferase family 2 protein n=1 Tax=Yoonia sp. TaxID=2212373 RepID=UPI002E0592F1|nr:glycosyltransferase family 2 protein [Yoonia sp.]
MTNTAALPPPALGGSHVIMSTMKNEGPFLLEWIAHNLAIGFTGFVVFTNDCEDGTDLMLQRLEELGYCSHRPNDVSDGSPPQHKALRRATAHPWVMDADWLMCLDVDEFINLREGLTTLDQLMAKIGNCDAVSFVWKLFGCGGIGPYEDRPVMEQFTLADIEDDPANGRATGFKTLFRNNGLFRRFNPHRPKNVPEGREAEVRWSDCGGNHRPMDQIGWRAWEGFSHEYARLNHYSVRSLDSFLVKRDRGRTNHIAREQTEHYWSDMNVNRAEDHTMAPHADRARPLLAALKADPVLGALHDQACAWHRAKIAELKAREGWDAFYDWLYENRIETTAAVEQKDY